MATNEKGIIYYKLDTDKYEGDITKNCGLKGEEIDGNFHFLRGYDIKGLAFDKETQTITIERLDGEKLEVGLGFEFKDYDFSYDSENGKITISTNTGEETVLEGFIGQISKDFTLDGNGTKEMPLRVSNIAKTGTYRPAKSLIDLTSDKNNLPTENIHKNERYVTKEKISKFGKLYPLSGVQEISKRLFDVGNGWRIPTKADWDETLNVIECESHRNHGDLGSNVDLGEKAGYMLKSIDFWEPSETVHSGDAYGFSIYPVGYGDSRGESSIGGFGKWAAYWSTTEEDNHKDMYVKVFENSKDTVEQNTWGEDCYLSLRLVKDFNGLNFHGTEVIDGQTYGCVHIENPDTNEGSGLIWTKENVSFTNSQYKGTDSSEWENAGEEAFKTVYFVNDWNGFGWDKHELHEGESIVLFESPYDSESRMHEWRLVDGVLVDTADILKGEFAEEIEGIKQTIIESDNAVRQEFADADNVVRQESIDADNVVRQEFADADNVVRQEAINADNVVRQEFLEADNAVRQSFADADNVVRQEFLEADNAVRQSFADADNVVRQEFTEADNAVRQSFADADNVVRQEFTEADNVVRQEAIDSDKELQRQITENKIIDDISDNSIESFTDENGTTLKVKLPELGMIKSDEFGLYVDGNFGTF